MDSSTRTSIKTRSILQYHSKHDEKQEQEQEQEQEQKQG